jgi:hypothetical protein
VQTDHPLRRRNPYQRADGVNFKHLFQDHTLSSRGHQPWSEASSLDKERTVRI